MVEFSFFNNMLIRAKRMRFAIIKKTGAKKCEFLKSSRPLVKLLQNKQRKNNILIRQKISY